MFSYTILSASIFSAEKGKEAVHAGLETARSSMVITGPVLARDTHSDSQVEEIIFVVANSLEGEAVTLTSTTDSNTDGLLSDETTKNHTTVVTYIDLNQRVTDITWSSTQLGKGDGDSLLETGEKFEITVTLTALSPAMDASDTFAIEGTIPAVVDAVMDLR